DGVWLDCQRGAVRAIPAGPLAPRQSANLYLRAGRLAVLGGEITDAKHAIVEQRDGAVCELATGRWTTLDPGGIAGRGSLDVVPFDDRVAIARRDERAGGSVVAALWHPGAGAFTPIPGTERLDFGLVCTRLFGHGGRVLLFNSGMKTNSDEHRAFWLAPGGAGWLP